MLFRSPPDKDSKKVKNTETRQAPEGYKRVEKADDGEEPEVEKGQSVEGMFRKIINALDKLISSDKKVHTMKKSEDNMEVVEDEKIVKAEAEKKIQKAEPEVKAPSTEEIVKAALENQKSEIVKALDEKFSKLEERLKKIEEQPIVKAAIIIPEQAGDPITGNYSAFEQFSKRG